VKLFYSFSFLLMSVSSWAAQGGGASAGGHGVTAANCVQLTAYAEQDYRNLMGVAQNLLNPSFEAQEADLQTLRTRILTNPDARAAIDRFSSEAPQVAFPLRYSLISKEITPIEKILGNWSSDAFPVEFAGNYCSGAIYNDHEEVLQSTSSFWHIACNLKNAPADAQMHRTLDLDGYRGSFFLRSCIEIESPVVRAENLSIQWLSSCADIDLETGKITQTSFDNSLSASASVFLGGAWLITGGMGQNSTSFPNTGITRTDYVARVLPAACSNNSYAAMDRDLDSDLYTEIHEALIQRGPSSPRS
jgi:hypothetical protein